MLLTLIVLTVAGLIAGSFVNALVWRVRERETAKKPGAGEPPSIVRGRSMCPNCRHTLAARDLVPLFSWLLLHGRCRYCQTKIAWQYPIVELATGIIFILSYVFWPGALDSDAQWLLFATWLVCATGLMALLVYDLKWMLLPSKILYPVFLIAAAGRLAYIVGFAPDKGYSFTQWGLSLLVASGLFWLLFMVSSGRWIGYGDVRLGLITGTLLAAPDKSLLMVVLSAFMGTLVMVPLMIAGRSSWHAKVPYGPFLILATAISFLFGSNIIDWYERFATGQIG